MLQKLKTNFDAGVDKLKWYATVLNERLKIEVAVVKLLKEAKEFEDRRDVIMKDIGERVFELKDRQNVNAVKDQKIKDLLTELETLESGIKAVKGKISELGKAEE